MLTTILCILQLECRKILVSKYWWTLVGCGVKMFQLTGCRQIQKDFLILIFFSNVLMRWKLDPLFGYQLQCTNLINERFYFPSAIVTFENSVLLTPIITKSLGMPMKQSAGSLCFCITLLNLLGNYYY